jgi:Domain of unknown function (DUF4270)
MIRRTHSIKYRVFLFLPSAALIMLASCVKPNINFGTAFVSNNNTNIVVVDTFSALLSTVYVDSFPTAATGTQLAGRYKDNYLGLTTAKSYYQVAPPINLPTISNVATYDSIVLMTRMSGYFYGDTSKPIHYLVSKLSSTIQFPGTQFTFYNNDSVAYQSTPVGSANVIMFPNGKFTSQLNRDTLKMKLPDAMGLDLFNLVQSRSPIVSNTNAFLNYFKGFAFYSDDNNQAAIYGFKDSVIMRVYYHEPGVINQLKFADFETYNRNYQFNQLSTNRSGTPLQNITSVPPKLPGIAVELSSDSTNHASYVQTGSGMEMKVRFPYIWKLQQFPDFVSILRAELILKPVSGTYSPVLSLPKLGIYQTDEKNQLGVSVATATFPFVDYIYGLNTSYTYDITSYIRLQLGAGAVNNLVNGLMLVIPPPDYNTTVDRAVFGDKSNDINNRVILKIYYASFY